MGGSKIVKRAAFFAAGLFALLAVFIMPVSAGVQEGKGEYEIYPTPQNIVYEESTTELTSQVDVECGDDIDVYTKNRITATLEEIGLKESASASDNNTKLIVGVYGSAGDPADAYKTQMGVASGLFGDEKKFDAYSLWISNGKIVILGEDTDAAYMGVTTLKRIFEQLEGKTVRNLSVKDYAEVEYRGFIEGYYGNPWSYEDRKDLMEYGGEIKMNQYVFASKDDPFHRTNWRALYPHEGDEGAGKDTIERIAEMAQAGNESKCFYVYALHPFYTDKLKSSTYDKDLADLKAKFGQVIEAGVRQIAILEDDGSADGTWSEAADLIVRLLNDVTAWLEELKASNPEYSDLNTDLLFCPGYMSYANGMTGSNDEVSKIKRIHAGVGDNVRIVMTGGKIWGDVTNTFANNFYNKVQEENGKGRYPYLWVNWPCSDNTHDSLIMGGHNSILRPNLDGSKYHGVILNPMQDSEPSKVGIFTASDFLWNVWDGETEEAQRKGDQAWEDSFKYIDHMTALETKSSKALRDIAQHMITQSDTQASRTGSKFEESLNIKDDLQDFQEKLATAPQTITLDEINGLKQEFEKIKEDITFYLEEGTNQRMASQLTPYAESLYDTAEAAGFLIEACRDILAGNNVSVYDNFSKAQESFDASKNHPFKELESIQYAKGGRRYIIPFVETVLEYVSEELKQTIDPENIAFEKKLIYQIGGNAATASASQLTAATDGNLSTSVSLQTNQVIGDYAGLTFSIPVTVKNIRMYLGCDGHWNDYIAGGVMEYTEDGKAWKAFSEDMQPEAGTEVNMEFSNPVKLRGFRWKCTDLGSPSNRWLIVREIGYNMKEVQDTGSDRYEATFSCTKEWSLKSGSLANMTDGNDGTEASWDPSKSQEDGVKDHSQAGDYIQIDLGEVKEIGRVRAIVGGSKAGDKWTKYHLEYSETGSDGAWTELDSYTDSKSGAFAYEVDLKGKSARYLRMVNDMDVHKWVYFGGFEAYPVVEHAEEPEGSAMDYTNTNDAGWRVEYGEASSKVFPRKGAVLKPGEYIGLKLSRIREVSAITVTGSGTEKLTLEKSANKVEWTSKDQTGGARYIRLINRSGQPIGFDLDSFTVESVEVGAKDLLSASKDPEGYEGQDARNSGETGNWFDGDKSTKAKYCFAADTGDFIIYDLGQEIDIRSMKVWVGSSATDYPRQAKIQAALTPDASTWQDIVEIAGEGGRDAFSTTPIDNHWNAGEGAIDVNYAWLGTDADFKPVKARYIRLYITGDNAGRYVELNEIEINEGEYLPEINDPTYETDAKIERGFEPQNLRDGNFVTAFRPAGGQSQSGYLIYHLSDTVEIGQLNILQSGSSISNAAVSVRTGADTWQKLGILDKSLTSFDTTEIDAVYAVKIEWENVQPVLYEIAPLLGPKLEKANQKVEDANGELRKAETALDVVNTQISAAESKVASAANEEEKLKAEAELQALYAKRAETEAVVAEKKGIVYELESAAVKIEAEKMWMLLKNAVSDEEKAEITADAVQKEGESVQKAEDSTTQKAVADTKKKDQNSYIQAAAAKQEELKKLQQSSSGGQSQVKEFSDKTLKYEVINAEKKTVAVAGPVNKKKVKTVKINPTVKYDGITYTVVQIKANAFKGCKKLTSVTIGSNVTSIGKQAFAQCSKLKTVNMKKASKITSFGSKSFSKINAKAKITVPAKKLSKYKKALKRAGVPKKATIKK